MNSDSKLALCLLIIDHCMENGTQNKRKRIWARDRLLKRRKCSHLELLKELECTSAGDPNCLRMDLATYQELLRLLEPSIKKKDTLMRDAISPNERLAATLKFLASGQNFENLISLTAISSQSISQIVMETCSAIIKIFKTYIKIPKTEEDWRSVAADFEKMWNFPNCIGAIDGKHIEIKKPVGSGSSYFNYNKSFSIAMMAIVNANYEFIMVEVGTNGRISDDGIFAQTIFEQKYDDNELNIPTCGKPTASEKELPFVLVGDAAFPLLDNLMIPYRSKTLTEKEENFNYRLARVRRIAENAFGILSSRFRVLQTTISLCPEKASTIVLACCYLHNFLMQRNPSKYLQGSVDIENASPGEIHDGSWRSARQLLELEPLEFSSTTTNAEEIRNGFCEYFNTIGAVKCEKRNP